MPAAQGFLEISVCPFNGIRAASHLKQFQLVTEGFQLLLAARERHGVFCNLFTRSGHQEKERDMSEAATVLWFPSVTTNPIARIVIHKGEERHFESLENAVRFVMKELSEETRLAAMIQTDRASYDYSDFERLYKEICPPA